MRRDKKIEAVCISIMVLAFIALCVALARTV